MPAGTHQPIFARSCQSAAAPMASATAARPEIRHFLNLMRGMRCGRHEEDCDAYEFDLDASAAGMREDRSGRRQCGLRRPTRWSAICPRPVWPRPANAAARPKRLSRPRFRRPGGLTWTFRATDRTALFGPPGSPAFSIQCQKQREGPKPAAVRPLPAPVARRQGDAELHRQRPGRLGADRGGRQSQTGSAAQWRAVVVAGRHRARRRRGLRRPGTVEVSVSGTPPLVVPAASRAAPGACRLPCAARRRS